jgi:N6-L-threonylcarbamoyladenine synthase
LTNIQPVIKEALHAAGHSLASVDAVAVTCRPGLSGALLIGTQVAHALAWSADKPLLGVDHLVGHLLAPFLEFPSLATQPAPRFPFIGLVASGGHTALYRVDGPDAAQIVELGATRDDAAGEAYDKVAKLLGLGYPGGPLIDRLAQQGDPTQILFKKPMPALDSLEFSFSGLKTQVARWVQSHGLPAQNATLRDLCAAFQRCVVDTLLDKSVAAARAQGLDTVVLCGGVSANSELRRRGQEHCAAQGITLHAPHLRACTDNAAMIAYAGSFMAQRGGDERGRLTISPRSVLPRLTKKGGGPRSSSTAR